MRTGSWFLACLGCATVIGIVLAQEGQYAPQAGAAADGGFIELDDVQLSILEVDELPLTEEGVVDDDGWAADVSTTGAALVDEDVLAVPDDRPEALLDEMIDG